MPEKKSIAISDRKKEKKNQGVYTPFFVLAALIAVWHRKKKKKSYLFGSFDQLKDNLQRCDAKALQATKLLVPFY